MLKKCKLVKIIPFVLFSLTACGGETPGNTPEPIDNDEDQQTIVEQDPCAGDPVYTGQDVNVSKIVHNDHGYHISVNDKDFLFLGTQIRVDAFMNCDHYTYADVRNLFKEASLLGVNCVEIPVEWSKVEIAENVYDYKYVHEMIHYAEEFNLKVEFNWFGSNMCGDTHSYSVPNYIIADGKTYPKFDASRTGEFWNYYGIMWFLDFDNPNLIARERLAVRKFMDYIYEYDSTHGCKNTVIGIQVENEVDIFPRWRIEHQAVVDPLTGVKMSQEVGFNKVVKLVDEIGKEIKQSKYKVYTRVNLASSTQGAIYSGDEVRDVPAFAKLFNNLEGIDIIGDDTYSSSVKNIKGITAMFRDKLEHNFSHVAENDGSYSNTPSLILASVSQHGGYAIYDLMTSPFYIDNGTGNVNQGIINPGSDRSNFVHTAHFDDTKALLAGLNKAESEVYKVSPDDFIAFNLAGNYPQDSVTQTISSTNCTLEFNTSQKAIGYALDFGEYVDVLVTNNSTIKLSNGTVTGIQRGSLSVNGFEAAETLNISDTISLTGGEFYRISYTSNGKIASTTWTNIG